MRVKINQYQLQKVTSTMKKQKCFHQEEYVTLTHSFRLHINMNKQWAKCQKKTLQQYSPKLFGLRTDEETLELQEQMVITATQVQTLQINNQEILQADNIMRNQINKYETYIENS
jgi:hypothetical protein